MAALALRANARNFFGIAAVMAQEAPVALVIRQGERTVHALHALAAGAAGNEARKPAAVEQHDGLLALLQALAERVDEFARERVLLAGFEKLLAHIDQFDGRH